MDIKKLETYITNITMVGFGAILISLSVYGWICSANSNTNRSHLANIIGILIGLFVAAAPIVKSKRTKKYQHVDGNKEEKNQISVFYHIGVFFHWIARATIVLVIAGTGWMLIFAPPGGASGVPIALGIFVAGFLHAIGSVFIKYYGGS